MAYHEPVMLRECLEGLRIDPSGIYVDVTFGGGGHAKAILEQLTTGKLVAFDQDADAKANTIHDERLVFVQQNFRHLKRYLQLYNLLPIHGLLADLGISSHQIDTGERGFSTRYNAALDMRMDREQELTAADVVNGYLPQQLQTILGKYGEVRNARTLAAAIAAARPVTTTGQLVEVCKSVAKGNIHQYLAQVFQALRIEVNDEMGALETMLQQCTEVIQPGGRLVVMSYHSLEDRLVKNFIKTGNTSGEPDRDPLYGTVDIPFKPVNRKPIMAGDDEIERNPRARSAKLRIAERVKG